VLGGKSQKVWINLCSGVVCSELWWYTTKCKQSVPKSTAKHPEDGIVLPKHVGAIVKSERNIQLSAFVGLSFMFPHC
jgi:hypothetical protein